MLLYIGGTKKGKELMYPQFQNTVGTLSIHQQWLIQVTRGLNLNSLLVKCQIDNPSPGAVTGGKSLALTRQVNLDTLSSDSSEEEIRDSGRSFQSLIVWGKKLYL